ncbi:MAG: 5-bromo-4-chloroindolyl phosphate hydrolysis family protein [Acetatifactor sp.]|nr:5-bromo-4-chloroindolyl phosphate hydrolysis family protein [Acetatifactor sp.]MDE7354651.1 5-bromo-4-chloroindolyl phosphate hydrolysis family protein [Acetatifactor sp.]
MGENQTWSNLGREIRNAVEDAVETGNFVPLSDVLSDTVTSAIHTVKEQIARVSAPEQMDVPPEEYDGSETGGSYGQGGTAGAGGSYGGSAGAGGAHGQGGAAGTGGDAGAYRYGSSGKSGGYSGRRVPDLQEILFGGMTSAWQSGRQAKKQQEKPAVVQTKAPFRKIGSVSGILYQVFGGIGTGIMTALSCVFLGLGLVFGGGFQVSFCIFVLLLIGFIIMINVGCHQKSVLKRAEKYRELSGHRHYVNLEDLALHTNRPLKFILKDVKKMLTAGFFPEGHLDRQESCLMLDDKIYQEYLSLEKQRRMEERERQAGDGQAGAKDAGAGSAKAGRKGQKPEEAGKQGAEAGTGVNSELEDMISEGQVYIRRLRDMNDNIPGESISTKLFRLENLLKEIFDRLRDHPEQMPQMRKFMNYYLPTTIKLVGAYEEFDSMSVQGEDIREAKEEIEKTLDTINKAFGELLNKLFRETAYDVTADAQVLQAMLAREGLAGEPEFEEVRKS